MFLGRRQPKTVAIIGAGRIGSGAAEEFLKRGHHVLMIDRDPEPLEPFAPVCHTAIGNAEDVDFLIEVGVKNVDAVIVAIGDNETSSNHATINCKDFGLYVVAKATHQRHGKILKRLGADKVVYPERDSGIRLARMMTRSSILETIDLYEQVTMAEIVAGGDLVDRTLMKLDLPKRFGVQVVLIIRGDETVFPVSASDTILEGDRLVVLGSADAISQLAKLAER